MPRAGNGFLSVPVVDVVGTVGASAGATSEGVSFTWNNCPQDMRIVSIELVSKVGCLGFVHCSGLKPKGWTCNAASSRGLH